MIIIDEALQRTPEWHAARLGNVTASAVKRIGRRKDGTWTADAIHYAHELVAERLTGRATDHFESADMRWGTQHEAAALSALGKHLGAVVWACGYTPHPRIQRFGASPDGLAGDSVVEVKCPKSSTHVAYHEDLSIPDEYMDQAAAQLACIPSALEHVFASYDPRFPEKLQLLTVLTPRTVLAEKIAEVETRVADFLSYVDVLETVVRR